jgi:hypothetical protein
MRNLFFAALATIVTLTTASYAADDRNITFVNATGYGINFVGVNPPGDDDWTDNEISSVLKDKDSVYIKFNEADKGCRWTIRVTWEGYSTAGLVNNVNLCEIDVITLHYDRSTNTLSYTDK